MSLARPGGNLTGINTLSSELAAKRLELLRELVPGAVKCGRARQPGQCADQDDAREVEIAARAVRAADSGSQRQHQRRDRCGFRNTCARTARRAVCRHLAFCSPADVCNWYTLAALHTGPRDLQSRQFAEIGGLMSYGSNIGYLSSARRLYRSHPQGRQARGPAGGAVEQARAGHQRPDRQDARPRCAADICSPAPTR